LVYKVGMTWRFGGISSHHTSRRIYGRNISSTWCLSGSHDAHSLEQTTETDKIMVRWPRTPTAPFRSLHMRNNYWISNNHRHRGLSVIYHWQSRRNNFVAKFPVGIFLLRAFFVCKIMGYFFIDKSSDQTWNHQWMVFWWTNSVSDVNKLRFTSIILLTEKCKDVIYEKQNKS